LIKRNKVILYNRVCCLYCVIVYLYIFGSLKILIYLFVIANNFFLIKYIHRIFNLQLYFFIGIKNMLHILANIYIFFCDKFFSSPRGIFVQNRQEGFLLPVWESLFSFWVSEFWLPREGEEKSSFRFGPTFPNVLALPAHP